MPIMKKIAPVGEPKPKRRPQKNLAIEQTTIAP